MKSKTLRNIKVVSFLAILLIAFFMSFSCDNLFSDVHTSQTTPNETVTTSSEGSRTITVTGKINNPYAESRGTGRSAMPSHAYIDSEKRYVVRASAEGVSDVTGNGDTSTNTFSVPLTLGKTWTIRIEFQKKEDNDTDFVKVMEGSFTFSQPLSELTSDITIEIKPTTSNTGNIELSFTPVGDTVIYDSVTAEPVSTEQKTEWSTHVTTSANGIHGTGIKSGVYSVTISFYLSNVLVYATMQEITVYDNMTTNVWDGSGSNSPINNGTFTVTSALTERFKLTNYFVKSDGIDSNSGTPYYPIKTIDEALRRINVTGESDKDYTIWLMSDITASVSLAESSYLSDKASSITIRPMRNQVTVSGSSSKVFDIRVPVPFTFENLTITGGAPSAGLGGAIHIESNAKVTLSNCTITGNASPSNSNGGGIFNSGTLNVKGKVIISGNTKGSGSNAVENNIFLYENKKINIVGALDPDSRIGVITGTKPGYNAPHVFTSGFAANSGLDSSLISTIFTCDEGYAVVASGSGTNVEAALEASGGSISNAFDYAVTLSCADEQIASGSIITVTADVTNGDTPVTPAAEDITWNFELLCYGDTVATIPSYAINAASGSAKVTIPTSIKLFADISYTLHATAVINGLAYDENFIIPASSLGFVSVSGAVISSSISDSEVFNGRTLSIPNMYVSNHEVTQAEYEAVMGENPSAGNSNPASGEIQKNRPVENVSWYDAIMYCNKKSITDGFSPCYAVNGKTDPNEWNYTPHMGSNLTGDITCNFNADGYRLPTEAEWEYIARGGNGLTGTQYKYSGSNNLDDVAWYSENSGTMTHEVMKKLPNSLGIYDMTGNVMEWCWDFWGDGNIDMNTPATGVIADNGSNRINRGCDYTHSDERHWIVSYRSHPTAWALSGSRGFRVVRTNDTPTQLPSGTSGTAGDNATYMYFGEWPQTIIASGVTVNENITKEMGAFTYYFGSDGAWYVKQVENAYGTNYTYSNETSVAQGGTSYKYFKVEPIKWRVLTTNYNGTGKKLLLAENILSNIQFYDSTHDHGNSVNITVHANNYEHSRIRAYLNGIKYDKNVECNDFVGKGFVQTAFTNSAQSQIANTTVMVGVDAITNNKVFLLSIEEADESAYGFAEASSRIRNTTDFAKASGAVSAYWLRSPSENGDGQAWSIGSDGVGGRITVHGGHYGVLPAICIDN